MSNSRHLIGMANDIGNFFRAQPPEEAVSGIANHIKNYWTRRMREKLIREMELGASDLDPLPREAMRRLAEHRVAEPHEPPGGDAG